MQDYKKILKLRFEKKSQRYIANSLQLSRNTIKKIYDAADQAQLFWNDAQFLDNAQIHSRLFPESLEINLIYQQPDYEYVHKELAKVGVSLQMLWEEYVQTCKANHKPYYQRTWFIEKYHDYAKKHNLTMHINHKPGDKMMVDWAGKTMEVYDSMTGEVFKAYLFVATLPFSMYSYVQACPTMNMDAWIECHIKAFQFFGGVPRLLVLDNLKTGVNEHKKYEDPILNKSYQEMADHYDIAAIPARVKAPKDKAAVEGSVNACANSIIGKLRNRKFFDYDSLNRAILSEVDKFNSSEFKKREGSRLSVFEEEEKDYLHPLPEYPFELRSWKQATVQLTYHIQIDKMNYSVPYEYVGKRVEVKMTKSQIEVFYKGTRISSHTRLYGKKNQYSTTMDHMPENHQKYEWNSKRFRNWAEKIGPATYEVIDKLVLSYKVEEQSYKGCLSLLKLSDKYTGARLESACRLALDNISKPSYKNIRMILESGQDKVHEETKRLETISTAYAFVRGKDYYGNRNN